MYSHTVIPVLEDRKGTIFLPSWTGTIIFIVSISHQQVAAAVFLNAQDIIEQSGRGRHHQRGFFREY